MTQLSRRGETESLAFSTNYHAPAKEVTSYMYLCNKLPVGSQEVMNSLNLARIVSFKSPHYLRLFCHKDTINSFSPVLGAISNM